MGDRQPERCQHGNRRGPEGAGAGILGTPASLRRAPDEGRPPADMDGRPWADGARWQAGQARAGHLLQRITSRDAGILTKRQLSWFLLQQGRWQIL